MSAVGLIKGTVVANSVCAHDYQIQVVFLFVLYQRGRAASRDNIQYEKHQFFLFFNYLIKKNLTELPHTGSKSAVLIFYAGVRRTPKLCMKRKHEIHIMY